MTLDFGLPFGESIAHNIRATNKSCIWPSESRSNWNLEVLAFFWEKPEIPENKPWSKDENQQQTQPAYDGGSGKGTWATLATFTKQILNSIEGENEIEVGWDYVKWGEIDIEVEWRHHNTG